MSCEQFSILHSFKVAAMMGVFKIFESDQETSIEQGVMSESNLKVSALAESTKLFFIINLR